MEGNFMDGRPVSSSSGPRGTSPLKSRATGENDEPTGEGGTKPRMKRL